MTPKYFLELGQTMGRVEVSDNTLGRVDYDEGMRCATNIVRSQTGAGGRSENILRVVDTGFERGCRVVTFSGFRPDNPLRARGVLNF